MSGPCRSMFHFVSRVLAGRGTQTAKWCSKWEEKPIYVARPSAPEHNSVRFSPLLTHRLLGGGD